MCRFLPAAQASVRSGVLYEGFHQPGAAGKVSGRWTIQLSRKVVAPDGQVLGWWWPRSIKPLVQVYEAARLGAGGRRSLAGFDWFWRACVVGGEQNL